MNIKQYITHRNIHFIALCMLIGALPLSKFMMSVAQIILLLNWIIEGDIQQKIKQFFTSKTALVFSSIFILHIIGVLYSSDLSYAYKDLRTKIPWLIVPLVLSTGPALSKKQINQILISFIGFVVFASLISTYFYIFTQYDDIRHISKFISHIRFSLFIDLSIFFSIFFILNKSTHTKHRILYSIIAIWLLVFLFILQSATGILILFISAVIISIWQLLKFAYSLNNIYKITITSLIIIIPLSATLFTIHTWTRLTTPEIALNQLKLDSLTKNGNQYMPNLFYEELENGNYMGIYICQEELEQEWNKRSRLNYKSSTKKGYGLNYTLIRYLTSKGLRKDSTGIAALTNEDIQAIENGVGNYLFLHPWGIQPRLAEFYYSLKIYTNNKNPNGSTIFQRIEYWKASINIIKQSPLFGIGTGDNDIAFKTYYQKTKSKLLPEFRHRSHNQFLAITISLGIVGLLIFLISIVFPPYKKKTYNNVLFTSFFLIAVLSMLTEDTLESQAGITFFIFFYSLFVFSKIKTEQDILIELPEKRN